MYSYNLEQAHEAAWEISGVPEMVLRELDRVAEALVPKPAYVKPGKDKPAMKRGTCILGINKTGIRIKSVFNAIQ